MSDTKPHQFRPPLYHRDAQSKRKDPKSAAGSRASAEDTDKGWEAYRKWLSTMSSKSRPERSPVDRSIYSWKGYHSWADKVKQSWTPEDN